MCSHFSVVLFRLAALSSHSIKVLILNLPVGFSSFRSSSFPPPQSKGMHVSLINSFKLVVNVYVSVSGRLSLYFSTVMNSFPVQGLHSRSLIG